MSIHEALKEAASQSIKTLHSDQSVTLNTTLESLEELQGELTSLIEAVRSDLGRKGE